MKSGASNLKELEAGWDSLTGVLGLEFCSCHQLGFSGVLHMASRPSQLGLPHNTHLRVSAFFYGTWLPPGTKRGRGQIP